MFDGFHRDLVGGAGFLFLLAVSRTVEVFLLFHRRTTAEIHLLSTVRTVHKSRKNTHLSHIRRSAFGLSQTFHNPKCFLVDDCLVGVSEYHPFVFRKFYLLFGLIRFLSRAEVDRMPEIGGIGKDRLDRFRYPNFGKL